MAGNPRIQTVVCKRVFERAHERALNLGITTSEWLRRLIREWDGNASVIQLKQLSVRLDGFHLRRLDKLATRSEVSRSKAFALLIERALVGSDNASRSAQFGSDAPTEHRPAIPEPDAYDEWATLVIQAAKDTPQKFNERKAFISGVLEELQAQLHPADPGRFRALVKRLLPQLNRLGLVALARADLVPLMNPEWVAASEIKYDVATFHFVDLSRHLPGLWSLR